MMEPSWHHAVTAHSILLWRILDILPLTSHHWQIINTVLTGIGKLSPVIEVLMIGPSACHSHSSAAC